MATQKVARPRAKKKAPKGKRATRPARRPRRLSPDRVLRELAAETDRVLHAALMLPRLPRKVAAPQRRRRPARG